MTLRRNECGYWEMWIRVDGKYHSLSTKTKDRREAERIAESSKIEDMEVVARAGVLSQAAVSLMLTGKKTTVESAMVDWIKACQNRGFSYQTIQAAEGWARSWASHSDLLKRPISSITESDISCWINRESKTKASSREVMLSYIRSFFSFCVHKGWVLANPSATVHVDLSKLRHDQKEVRKRIPFTDEEVDRMLEITGPESNSRNKSSFWHAAIVISRWTGLRMGDICTLEWASLAVPSRIIVWTMKRDKRIEVPIEEPKLRDVVDNLIYEDPEWVFPYYRNIYIGPFRDSIRCEFNKIVYEARIKGKSFHCLRHSYVESCHAAGVPMPIIAANVGHSHVSTTLGYLQEA